MNLENGIRLGVNIDHVATLREARYRDQERLRGEIVEPDPLAYALAAERAGADGITVHPREDARHIRRDDVRALRGVLQVPLNMEMACLPEMEELALEVCPASVCLVPEKRDEVTTEGGLDITTRVPEIRGLVERLSAAHIRTSLFIDPDHGQITASLETGAWSVELHTGAYANAYYGPQREREVHRLEAAAEAARAGGLVVNLGHGINYVNVHGVRAVPGIHEMNIGHSIISRSLFTGVEEAVREMKARMNGGFPR